VSHIEAVFTACGTIRRMALEGASDREIGESLAWRIEDVQRAARLMGFSVSPVVKRQQLCAVCGHLLQPDGYCVVCALRRRLERLYAVNAEEHRREVERLERDVNVVKSDTRHVRKRMGTSPRRRDEE
jgi:hypothetical protein